MASVDGRPEGETARALKKLTVLKILRPDRFVMATKMFVA